MLETQIFCGQTIRWKQGVLAVGNFLIGLGPLEYQIMEVLLIGRPVSDADLQRMVGPQLPQAMRRLRAKMRTAPVRPYRVRGYGYLLQGGREC